MGTGVQTVRDVSMTSNQLPVVHVSMPLASSLLVHVNSTILYASMASPSTSHALGDLPTMRESMDAIGLISLSIVYLKRLLGSDAQTNWTPEILLHGSLTHDLLCPETTLFLMNPFLLVQILKLFLISSRNRYQILSY